MEAAEFNRIARKYTDVVYRATLSYCKNKNDAEDAVQNTFLKLLKTDTQFADDEHIENGLSGRRSMNVRTYGNPFGTEMLHPSTS